MKRVLRRATVGAAAFFAASALSTPGALAETTADLQVAFKGTTLAGGVADKDVMFAVTNSGPQAATDITFDFDLSGVVDAKASIEVPPAVSCADPNTSDEILENCAFGSLDPNTSHDFIFRIHRLGGATGDGGTLKVTVKAAQDENTSNNTATATINLSTLSGVDLVAWVPDISELHPEGGYTDIPVQPGALTKVFAGVGNQGSVDSHQLKMEIKLPQGVTFVGSEPSCDYSTGSTSTTCTYSGEDGLIKPTDFWFYPFEVKIADDVVGPVTLGGGVLAVTDLPQAPSAAPTAPQPSTKNRVAFDLFDIDATDNVDEFNALVGKKGGQGGNLPLTGANIGSIAAVGAGVLVAGGALFLITRRRRVAA